MVVEVAAIGAVASAGNVLITLFKHGLHYAEIPAEVEQFRHAIDNLQSGINTSKRLRRVKSSYLDGETKAEVDDAISRSESVMDSIARTIEGCRVDLQTKGTVSAKNRVDWLMRGHQAFMARGMTLNSCLQSLSMQIGRMDALQPPQVITGPLPPSYRDSLRPDQPLRGPAARRARARTSHTGSQAAIDENTSTCSLEPEKEPSRNSFNDGSSRFSSLSPRRKPVRSSFSSHSTTFSNMDDLASDRSYTSRSIPTYSTEKEVVITRVTSNNDTDKEVVVSRVMNNGNIASMYSMPTRSSVSSISFSSCSGDYCTDNLCPNHDRRTAPLEHTMSLDSGLGAAHWSSAASSTTTLTPRSLPPRRRHKSGLI